MVAGCVVNSVDAAVLRAQEGTVFCSKWPKRMCLRTQKMENRISLKVSGGERKMLVKVRREIEG